MRGVWKGEKWEGRGKGERGKGEQRERENGSGHGMGREGKGKGKEEGDEKGREGLQPPNFNFSWRRHWSRLPQCVQFTTCLLVDASQLNQCLQFLAASSGATTSVAP